MNRITVDDAKCKRDGLCAVICPLQIIAPPEKGKPPELKPESAIWCIGCGHCVAVCPAGALRHTCMGPDQCPPADYKSIPGPDRLESLLRLRRSIRRFKKQQPEKETLEQMIRMAGYAPSGHNRQPVHWMVFENRENLDRMVGMAVDWMKQMLRKMPDAPHSPLFREIVSAWDSGRDLVLHGAPCLAMAHSNVRTGTESIDAAISLAYFDLAAMSFGLGCCWAGLFMMAARSWEPLGEFLNLPQHHHLHGAMMVGYPKFRFHRLPVRKPPIIGWR